MMRHRKKHAESGSLSPSDDEGETNNAGDDLSSQKTQRPILPRLSMPLTVPTMTMPVMPPMSLSTNVNGGETVGVCRNYCV